MPCIWLLSLKIYLICDMIIKKEVGTSHGTQLKMYDLGCIFPKDHKSIRFCCYPAWGLYKYVELFPLSSIDSV